MNSYDDCASLIVTIPRRKPRLSDPKLNRDERIDVARWLWDVAMSGRAKSLNDARLAMQTADDVLSKLAQDLTRQAEEMRDGQMDAT